MSPYLFVSCIEKSTNLIESKVDKGTWHPLRNGSQRIVVSHFLFFIFANDVILFC